jgi:hypothetical protein
MTVITSARIRRGLTAVVAVTGLAALGAIALPAAAQAVELQGVTSVTFVTPPAQVEVSSAYMIQATWSVPATAQPGDTFSLGFPNELTSYSPDFTLKDPSGAEVAKCTSIPSLITCTLGDYVTGKTDVHGTMYFKALAVKTTTAGSVSFTTTATGTVVSLPLPGTGIVPAPTATMPDGLKKYNWTNPDGSLGWELAAPASMLGKINAQDPVLTDTYPAGLTPASSGYVGFYQATPSDSTRTYIDEGTSPGTYSYVASPSTHSFTVQFHDIDTSLPGFYAFVYNTSVEPGTPDKTTFSNTVTLGSQSVTASTVYSTAGGNGVGDNLGGFSVTKAVTGAGATAAAGSTYSVDYSYTPSGGAPVSGVVTVQNGQTQSVTSIPKGTVVTLSEEAPAAVAGVSYGSPSFTGTGVTQTGSSATLTIGSGSTVAVNLENPTELLPGGFDITKHVTGDGAEFVKGTTYLVDFSYLEGDETVSGTIDLVDGDTWTSDDIAPGTVVTLTEKTPTATTGIDYGKPIFTGEGVSQDGRTATFTIGVDEETVVDLENPTTVDDTTLANTPGDPTPLPGALTPTPGVITPLASADSKLAFTGSDAAPVLAGGLALLLLGGISIAFASTRRRRASHR